MRTCKETAILITRASRSQLRWRDGLALRLHLMICGVCRNHRRQTETLRLATRRLLQRGQLFSPLSDPARQRIRHAVEHAADNN